MSERTSRERIMWSRKTGKLIRHGTPSSYNNHGCRCDECYEARVTSPGRVRELELQRAIAEHPRTEGQAHA